MEASDLIQIGDVFATDFQEYTVLSVDDTNEQIKVENLAGMTEFMSPRELIEIGVKETNAKPVSA